MQIILIINSGKIGTWIVDAKNGSGSVEFEGKSKYSKMVYVLSG